MAKILTKDAILAADDIAIEEIYIEEWAGVVRVRGLTGAERDDFEAAVSTRNGTSVSVNINNLRARLIAMSVIDEDGNQVFELSDIHALGQKSGAALDRVFSVAQRLSGLSRNDVKELTENFTGDRSDDSTSS